MERKGRGCAPPDNGETRYFLGRRARHRARLARVPQKARGNSNTLRLIALFKLLKGIALLAAGIGALRFLHRDIAQTVEHWVNILRVDPNNHFVNAFLARVLRINPHQLKALSAGTFIYAALLLTEGTGLLLRQRWAEYFTILTTGGLIPLEVYELAKHITWIKIVVLIVNVAIVVYLVVGVRRNS
jgi:uncharacterized membrane protein (DUF2068 family)